MLLKAATVVQDLQDLFNVLLHVLLYLWSLLNRIDVGLIHNVSDRTGPQVGEPLWYSDWQLCSLHRCVGSIENRINRQYQWSKSQ